LAGALAKTVQSLPIIRHRRFALLAGSSSESIQEKRAFVEADLLVEEVAKREIASILRCDLSLMISEYEMQLLTEIFKIDSSLLFYLPLLLEEISNADIDMLPSFEERNNFVFIGNFSMTIGMRSIFKNYLASYKKQLPQAVLNVYGAYPSQKVLQLNNIKEGFIVRAARR
jgi:hypothetical protein